MNHLFNLLFITLLLLNLTGLTLAGMRLSRLPYGLAKAATVLAGCMIFFFIEHFIGLGSLGWLLPISTVGSLWIIWKQQAVLRQNLGGEAVFLAAFGYTLAWRYVFPDIDPSSEKLADLNFVASYLQGARLPGPDLWLPPYELTQYYSFQHYAAALMGRILQVPCGTAYNLGYCVIVGLVLAPAGDFIRVFTASRSSRIFILAALLMGGTGACMFTPFLVKKELTFSSMRFIGATDADDDEMLTPLGIALRKFQYGSTPIDDARKETILEMPMEIFSYVVQLGDYHAPLGGYVLLATALAAFGVLLGSPDKIATRWALAILTGTIPLCIIVNTWSFPLQAILVAGCLAFLWRYRALPHWTWLTGLSLISWLLLYPCFSYFLTRTVGAAMKIEWVKPEQHAPWLSYLLQMWPTIALVVLAWISAGKGRREYRWFPVLVTAFLLLLEVVNINDIYGGRFERFNTTLKWWPWVAALALLLLAPLNVAAAVRSKFVRIGTAVVLLGTLVFIRPLLHAWKERPKDALGQLDGAAWLRQVDPDPAAPQYLTVNATIMNYLQANPGGVILEATEGDKMAFVKTGAMPLFTGHPTVFGWASHEQLWRGNQRDVEQRWNRTREFFRGEMAQPLDFLKGLNVRFIIWPGTEKVDPALFDKIKAQIEPDYLFLRMDEAEPTKGIWQRR